MVHLGSCESQAHDAHLRQESMSTSPPSLTLRSLLVLQGSHHTNRSDSDSSSFLNFSLDAESDHGNMTTRELLQRASIIAAPSSFPPFQRRGSRTGRRTGRRRRSDPRNSANNREHVLHIIDQALTLISQDDLSGRSHHHLDLSASSSSNATTTAMPDC